MTISSLRKEYNKATLSDFNLSSDPIDQFKKWFDDALVSKITEPNAMSLATVGGTGRPSLRIVLLKDYDKKGFTWYTNYNSKKGKELLINPFAAITFYWVELERQVRIEGSVKKVLPIESDEYFNKRPLKSKLGAIASDQSSYIENRADLEKKFETISKPQSKNPKRPKNWGGYRLIPDLFEFWQGRESRLHDRIQYSKKINNVWLRERLQP